MWHVYGVYEAILGILQNKTWHEYGVYGSSKSCKRESNNEFQR